MSFYAVKFTKEIPSTDILDFKSSHDGFALINIKDPSYTGYRLYYHTALTEEEYNIGSLFYDECREYRSAYSDVEGLEPDPESLAQGKRKTKVYKTPEIESITTSLMKKITKLRIKEEFDSRQDRSNEISIVAELDACTTIKQVCWFLEKYFGREVPWPLAREAGLIDSENRRINPPIWGVKF